MITFDLPDTSVLISHPTGNQNLRNSLRSLVEHNMLAEFWTTVAWDPESAWNRLLPTGLRSQLARRAYCDAPKKKVKCTPLRESVRLALRSSPFENLFCSGERPFSVIGMYRHFDGHVARRLQRIDVDAVYAYEGGALQTFSQATRLGIKTLYELPSSYWPREKDLLSEEAEHNPEFAGLIPALQDPPTHLQRKDEELGLADYVFVPSCHVKQSLSGAFPDERIRVIGYGCPLPLPRPHKPNPQEARGPLKVLFVGALIQRKGISYLLEAIDMLDTEVHLTLVGQRFRPNVRVDEACHRWRWFSTLPHPEVLNLMQESDVLILPSLTEAFGLVVTEALACGLPVIVTPNTGASEIIRDGREGYVVPIRRADIIASRLQTLHSDRELLVEMSRQAQLTAAQNSWERYRAQWARTIRSLV